jgi:hypothetical protein
MTAQPQHMVALDNANRTRLAIAAVKRELRAGKLTLPQALDDDRAQAMRVGDLLDALPRWGTYRKDKLLDKLKIYDHRRLRELTVRQTRLLRDHFDPPEAQRAAPAPPPSGMEPARQDARVVIALMRGPATRTELALRIKEMCLAVDDLDAALRRLFICRALVVKHADGFELYSVHDDQEAAA